MIFTLTPAFIYWMIPILIQVVLLFRTDYVIKRDGARGGSYGGAVMALVYLMFGAILSLLLWLAAVIGWAFIL